MPRLNIALSPVIVRISQNAALTFYCFCTIALVYIYGIIPKATHDAEEYVL